MELRFSNGYSIHVSTTFRSGTLNYLLISEMAYICKNHPDRAQEIVEGALEAVAIGQYVTIESTAMGDYGWFYQACENARKKKEAKQKLTKLDYKFHFFAWWEDPDCVLDPTGVIIYPKQKEYFKSIESKLKIKLTDEQKAFYVKKEETQGDKMKRNYPSTPKEAFASSIEGAYYAEQFTFLRENNRITRVPYEHGIPVNTAWDLGVNDETAIWFYQIFGREVRFIDYYANSGLGLMHYHDILVERGYRYGEHILPHDAKVRELQSGISRIQAMHNMGIRPCVIAPMAQIITGIECARRIFSICWFDEEKCAEGLTALENYTKQWDPKRKVWRDSPQHDNNSHASDAFRIFAVVFDSRQHKNLLPNSKNPLNKRKVPRKSGWT